MPQQRSRRACPSPPPACRPPAACLSPRCSDPTLPLLRAAQHTLYLTVRYQAPQDIRHSRTPGGTHTAAGMAQPTDYELQRAKRIQENKRKMEEMGLLAASRGLAGAAAAGTASVALAAGSEPAPRCKRRRAEPVREVPPHLSGWGVPGWPPAAASAWTSHAGRATPLPSTYSHVCGAPIRPPQTTPAGAAHGNGADAPLAPPARGDCPDAGRSSGCGAGRGGGRGAGAGAGGRRPQAAEAGGGPAAGGALQPVVDRCARRPGHALGRGGYQVALPLACMGRSSMPALVLSGARLQTGARAPPPRPPAGCRRDGVGAGPRAPWRVGPPLLVLLGLPVPPCLPRGVPCKQGVWVELLVWSGGWGWGREQANPPAVGPCCVAPMHSKLAAPRPCLNPASSRRPLDGLPPSGRMDFLRPQSMPCPPPSWPQVQFGRTYEMRIEEGPSGPLFKVRGACLGAGGQCGAERGART